jgi:hypothetical protein
VVCGTRAQGGTYFSPSSVAYLDGDTLLDLDMHTPTGKWLSLYSPEIGARTQGEVYITFTRVQNKEEE